MIACLPFWRVVAWISAGSTGLKSEGRKGELRWQDKSGAVGWGGECRNCWTFSASHLDALLAAFPEIDVFPPFSAPSPSRYPQFP